MQDVSNSSVKKTVVLHPMMDKYVRKTWAILIENDYDATYSMALNFMVLVAIQEGIKDGSLSDETRDVVWNFVHDQATIGHLNLQDHLSQLGDIWGATR